MSAAAVSNDEAREIATWESGDRSVGVLIETMSRLDGQPPYPPAICVRERPEGEAWDDLTADRARSLGAFLSTALPKAADQLEQMETSA